MGTSRDIETRGHIIGFREEISKVADSSEDKFFTCFNADKDSQESFVRGDWSFTEHVERPSAPFLVCPKEKTALGIGHGGGRLLAAAATRFREAIGIDIHDHNEKVENALKSRGIENVRLLKTGGTEIPLQDSCVDLVYSFIVMQHVERYTVVRGYLEESYRVLKPGGIGAIYFGRLHLLSGNRRSSLLYWADRIAETCLLPRGYYDKPARVNCTNLVVSAMHARRAAARIGFRVLATLVSHRHARDGTRRFGGQNGLLIQKPADP